MQVCGNRIIPPEGREFLRKSISFFTFHFKRTDHVVMRSFYLCVCIRDHCDGFQFTLSVSQRLAVVGGKDG